ncbi:piggyBac transposable element-derived protein 4-like [Leptopilina boulardi]|uniref:piggyBac transposable element-derived protein 4-like n=1 Tax=Leptopilina boulardi TaxID=63433 RepID=UPI0021F69093|nr:piggyBac transposable element-derived protein 4-like [Leptopilina boulardi]
MRSLEPGTSVDDLCVSDIDDDLNIVENRNDAIQQSSFAISDEEDSADDVSDSDEKWVESGKVKNDAPFTRNVGPDIPDNVKTPSEIFFCLFSDDLLDLIVQETNRYLQQKQYNQAPTTKEELLIFLGINILMGVKISPSYRDYWSSNPQLNDPYISSLMSVVRFGFFLGCIHINDNSTEPKKSNADYDKLYKLRPFLNKLNENFKKYFMPNKYQSVDESMIKFKGRSSMKQYMPLKPVKRGYKCWVRADSSAYVCEFQLYTGKTESIEKQLGARVVKDLTLELKGNNHHVYFDNFFTGVALMVSLKKDKIFACGTVRQNRSRLPKNNIQDKQMIHGDSEFRTSNTGIRWVKWMDKKAVYFLSNYHDPRETVLVNRKQKNGTLKPIIFHFLDVTVVNAYILYKEKKFNPPLTSKEFRLRLVDELVGHKLPSSKGKKRQLSSISSYKPKVSEDKRKSQSAHMPEIIASPRRCAHCSTKADQKRTSWMCKICNVPLCLLPARNSFTAYHC